MWLRTIPAQSGQLPGPGPCWDAQAEDKQRSKPIARRYA